jgi:hypothetical protein
MPARLLEIDDDLGRNFIIHLLAFHHEPVAIVAIRRADQREFG